MKHLAIPDDCPVIGFGDSDTQGRKLGSELVGFLNGEGGVLLLTAGDVNSAAGRHKVQDEVVELCMSQIEPPVLPVLNWIRDNESGRWRLVVRVGPGIDQPYAHLDDGSRNYYVRHEGVARQARYGELERLFQDAGRLIYGLKPVAGARLDHYDLRRVEQYFAFALREPIPSREDSQRWENLLRNLNLMTDSLGQGNATVDGMLLFGKEPKRFLPQSGIRALCYPETEPDYATRADEYLLGPMVPLRAANVSFVELGLVEQAWDFVRRNTTPSSYLDGMRRVDRWEYPESVIREAVVNALVHRDYTIAGSDISLTVYSDRLEIESPGRLPNTVTVEKMVAGFRYLRNQNLVNIMRDYGYMDARGMGVRNKIIPGMREHNGTEPDLIADDARFIVRLWK